AVSRRLPCCPCCPCCPSLIRAMGTPFGSTVLRLGFRLPRFIDNSVPRAMVCQTTGASQRGKPFEQRLCRGGYRRSRRQGVSCRSDRRSLPCGPSPLTQDTQEEQHLGIRETLNENPRFTTGLTVGIIVLVLGFLAWQIWGGSPASGSGGPTDKR